ncbi:hypothetical protein ABZX75_24770 [Streptomyces sp. NPDC003038]|uniref:SPW repeat domain-containing protein n=1 Tax=unclassified Streptomyces TaxID=2593676 RepID=UPI0033B04E9D
MSVYHHHPTPVAQDRRHALRQGVHDQLLGVVMLAATVALWAYPMATHDGAKDAQVNEAMVGVVLMFVVGTRLYRGGSWRSDVAVGVAGLWMIASPFIFGLQETAVDNGSRILDITTGSVLVIASAVALLVLRRDRRETAAEAEHRLPATARRRR